MGRSGLRCRGLFCISIFALLSICCGFGSAEGAFIRVPNDVSSIQAAINQAAAGDTVAVRPSGSYMERVVIDKEIVLLGGWDISYTTRDPSQFETIVDAAATETNPGQPITFAAGRTTATVLDGFTIRGGHSPQSTSFLGGGIYCEASSPTISNNLIRDNRANFGAGILCRNGANPVITGNVITANVERTPSGRAGCGIFCRRSAPTITNNDIKLNKGSGVRLEESPALIEYNTFSGNTDAGGVYCQDGSDAIVRYNHFEDNRSEFGGAVGIEDSSPTVQYNTVLENAIEVIQDEGGGAGMAVYGDTGSPIISHNLFERNFTTTDGGGILVKGSTTPTIENNLFKYNGFHGSARAQGGGGIVVQGNANAIIRSNTFFGNRAGRGGAILVRHNASATIERNIVFGSANGSGIWVDAPAGITLDCNCLSNNLPAAYVGVAPGATDIQVNPIFCRTSGDTLDLAYNSPCLPENNGGCGLIGAFAKGDCGAFPTNLHLVEPVNSAMLNYNTPTFIWTRSIDPDGGAIRFEFEIDEDPTFETSVVVNTGSDTSYTLQSFEALSENVTYYWHATAIDGQENSTTSDQIWALKIDLTDPRLTVGVHQHPYLDSYLDFYVVINEDISGDLDASLKIGASPQDLDMDLLDPDERLYHKEYQMTTSGTAILNVSGVDLAGNSSSVADTFAIEVLRPGAGATFASSDGGLTVSVREGAFPQSAYFLVKDLGVNPEQSPAIPIGDDARPAAVMAPYAIGGDTFSSRMYSVTWSPASSSLPVELLFDAAADDDASVYRWNGNDWDQLATYRDTETGKLYARATTPGIFQLRGIHDAALTHTTALYQNYPNPFRSLTTLAFSVGNGEGSFRKVSIKVFDVKGRLVNTLLDADLAPGPYAVTWDGRNRKGSACPSGLYLYRIEIENETPIAKKMILTN